MALTRKFLKALGIEEDKIEQIIESHVETVSSIKEERDAYKVNSDKLADVEKELEDVKTKSSKNNNWEVKYNALKEDFDTYKNEQTAKATKDAKINAYRKLLKDSGVAEKRIDAVLRVTNLDDFEIDENGVINDSDKISENIKDEWSDFIVEVTERGADVKNPPKGDGGNEKSYEEMTMDEYAKMRKGN